VHRWFGVVSVVPVTLSSRCESFLKVYRKGKQGPKGVVACGGLDTMTREE
ncbi:hypothetical protein A2U01_0080387, partial [Trifolium medium]|nr:hypothetical protein [Trifolium medium]